MVGPEGLLEPMRYCDSEGVWHYACPYRCPEEAVDFRSIEGMRGHISKVHGRGHKGFICDYCKVYTTKNKDRLRSHDKYQNWGYGTYS